MNAGQPYPNGKRPEVKTDRFESTDRDMSSWVLTCEHNGTRFFVNDEGTYTDMLSRARRFRWADQAEACASEMNAEPGFALEPMGVPEAMNAASKRPRIPPAPCLCQSEAECYGLCGEPGRDGRRD